MIEAAVEDYFSRLGYKPKKLPWNRTAGRLFQQAQVGGRFGSEPLWNESLLGAPEFRIALTGSKLEEVQMELDETKKQIEQTKDLLQETFNQMTVLANALFPAMKGQIEALRSTRMTLQMEAREALSLLNGVRSFFLDTDYDKEMQRIEKFVAVCREFHELKATGVLDDIADISIRMAIREERK